MRARLRQLYNNYSKRLKFRYLMARKRFSGPDGSPVEIKARYDGALELEGARKVAIFVNWDGASRVHDYVVEHLQALVEAGFTPVFVSNSAECEESEREKVFPYCAAIWHRDNRGYDFGSYRDAILELGDLSRLETLILCNDSVYGPFHKLGPILERCDPSRADVWGMTDSWQARYHLQSYFLLFHTKALTHKAFIERWQRFIHIDDKDWVVTQHEISLTGEMIDAGLRVRSLWRYSDFVDRFVTRLESGDQSWREGEGLGPAHQAFLNQMLNFAQNGVPMNINHFFWDELLLDGYPFIKRDLVSANPMQLPNTMRWPWMIRRVSGYDTDLIVTHLEATLRGRSI